MPAGPFRDGRDVGDDTVHKVRPGLPGVLPALPGVLPDPNRRGLTELFERHRCRQCGGDGLVALVLG